MIQIISKLYLYYVIYILIHVFSLQPKAKSWKSMFTLFEGNMPMNTLNRGTVPWGEMISIFPQTSDLPRTKVLEDNLTLHLALYSKSFLVQAEPLNFCREEFQLCVLWESTRLNKLKSHFYAGYRFRLHILCLNLEYCHY